MNRDLDTDLVVLANLFGEDIRIGKAICSPFGGDDCPSFSFYISSGDVPRLRYKLFNSGDNGSMEDFIMRYENIRFFGLASRRYEEIYNQSEISEKDIIKIKEKRTNAPLPKLTLKNYFSEWEKLYWLDYYIEEEQLIHNNVYSVDSLYYGSYCTDTSSPGLPVFSYIYPEFKDLSGDDGVIPYKIYSPEAEMYKWKSHNISQVICGYGQLPEYGHSLYIISSKKDGMCLSNYLIKNYNYSNYKDVAIISPPAEGCINPILNKEKELRDRFKNWYIIPDTDDRGLILADKLHDSLSYNKDVTVVDIDYGYDILRKKKCKDFAEGIKNNNNIILKTNIDQ